MTAAVILIWAGCLWSITRSVLYLLLTASPWRRLLTLAILLLTFSRAHKPFPKAEWDIPVADDKNNQ